MRQERGRLRPQRVFLRETICFFMSRKDAKAQKSQGRSWVPILCGYIAVLIVSCEPSDTEQKRWELLSGDLASSWASAGIEGDVGFEIASEELNQPASRPMSGARFERWREQKMPVVDYTIEYEAMRVEGTDFFGTVTFPVRSLETCASLVVGGWGGALVGISCIDTYDASENTTRSEQKIENGKWYHFRIEVRAEEIKVWMDGRIVVNTSISGRKVSLRSGDIGKCAPFGFATYLSTGKVRGVLITKLRPKA
jgi:hypothetical protein